MADHPSPRVVYDVTATLETLSPLHVGSGQFRTVATVEGRPGDNQTPEVAAVARDAAEAPLLPGTTIKGLLRRIGKGRSHGIDIDGLFGVIKADGSGNPGQVTVFGAKRLGSGPSIPDAPFVRGAEADLGQGVFVAARTRIDGATGTAGDHKLFHEEMVAPNTQFQLRLRIDARARVDVTGLTDQEADVHGKHAERATRPDRDARPAADRILGELLTVLGPLCDEDGQSVGSGYADGFGRLRLDPQTLKIERRVLGQNGSFDRQDATPAWKPAAASQAKLERLRLVCDGPFLVVDASKKPRAGENPEGERPHISPQSWNDRLPMLLGTSLSGALRARARWLAMREALRNGADDHHIRQIDPDDFQLADKNNIPQLSCVQRLFGVTGFRGRLAIARLKVSEAMPWDVTSVKLDRFTGGPIDNALFKTRAFLGAKLDLAFAIEERPSDLPQEKREEDRKLLMTLLADIRRNGLTLGHGGNKGFGWFRHEENGA